MSLCSKWLRYSVARFWWRLQSSYRPPFLYRLACRGTWGIRGFPWLLYLIDEELNLLYCFLLSHILLDTYTFSLYFRLYFWTCWFLFWVIVFTILSLLLLFIEISFPFFDHFMSAPFSNPFPSYTLPYYPPVSCFLTLYLPLSLYLYRPRSTTSPLPLLSLFHQIPPFVLSVVRYTPTHWEIKVQFCCNSITLCQILVDGCKSAP